MPAPRRTIIALAAAILAAGCREGAAVGPRELLVAGVYRLETVTGRGAAIGTLMLTPSGDAERRVRYARPEGGLFEEAVARGTYRVNVDGAVDFRLREDDGRSPYEWRPQASVVGVVLQLRHPDPADGPDIVESYRRP